MRSVVYAVNEPAFEWRRRMLLEQLEQSLTSLRRHNPTIDVRIFAFGNPAELEPSAEKHRVELVAKGAYADMLRDRCPASRAEVFARYPVMHKWLALSEIAQQERDQILYVDNDTFFFDDVGELFDGHQQHDFYAREEPFSSRSPAGYRPEYVDEPRLLALAEREGCRPIPSYNLGAVIMNHAFCERLKAAMHELFELLWRLCLGIVRDVEPAAYAGESELEYLKENLSRLAGADELERAPAYPSTNYWIVEQISFWLTLGKVASLTHGVFDRQKVIQGVEYHHFPLDQPLPVLAHYYSSNTEAFFSWQRRLETSRTPRP